jgi:hypothetical protein
VSGRKHTTLEALIDWRRGRAEAENAAAVESHLRTGCVRCAGLLATADRLLAAAAEPLAEPPAAALSRARALFDREPRPGLVERLRTLIAVLLPPPAPALAGLREASASTLPRLFEAGPWLVELRREPEAGRRETLRIRVAARDGNLPGDGGVARLERAGKTLGETPLDDLGEAICRGVPSGADRLSLVLGSDLVQVPLRDPQPPA